ncbi:MAG TPA: EamA family transporter [Candidatus Thermoplasmatota archaeon]|nr:EamA family transporter [Candidatus Thermoplasmatota archaeon]
MAHQQGHARAHHEGRGRGRRRPGPPRRGRLRVGRPSLGTLPFKCAARVAARSRGLAVDEPQAPDLRTGAAFATLVVLLGVNFVAVRFSNAELAPFWGAGLRFAVAAAALFGVALARGVPLPEGAALKAALLYGALAFGITYILVYWGLLFVPSGVTSVIFASIPLTTFVLALALRMEKFRAKALAGAALALAGIALISYGQLTVALAALPLLAIILSSVAAASSAIVVKRAPRAHPVSTNAVAMGLGAAMLLGVSLASGEAHALPSRTATWVAFLWLVTSSAVAFVIFIWILKRWTVTAASYQAVLSPLVTIAVASALVGEALSLSLAAGTALVLGGVFVGAIWRGPVAAGGKA